MTRRASSRFRPQLTPLGFTFIPFADVVLRHGLAMVRVPMIVDSGAEITMIPLAIGALLGFTRKRAEAVHLLGGISGSAPYLLRRAQLRIGRVRLWARVAWVQEDGVPQLLGRLDGFDRLRICFDQPCDRVEFRGHRGRRAKR